MVRTELGRHMFVKNSLRYFLLYPIAWYLLKTSEQGAQTTIYCAVDENLKNESGRYYSDCKEKQPQPLALIDEDAARLWNWSEETIKSKIEN